jgi:hypothetical protein
MLPSQPDSLTSGHQSFIGLPFSGFGAQHLFSSRSNGRIFALITTEEATNTTAMEWDTIGDTLAICTDMLATVAVAVVVVD